MGTLNVMLECLQKNYTVLIIVNKKLT